MKKLILTAALLTALISCKKSYTCECFTNTTENNNSSNPTITRNTYSFEAKKSVAESICQSKEQDSNYSYKYTVSTNTNNVTQITVPVHVVTECKLN